MGIKISVIGAGSSVFSLDLIRDLCISEYLKDCTVSFMDIDPERLESSYKLCVRYAEEMGHPLKIEKTTDRIESLTGADFVINTALHVNYDLWKHGWSIAKKYGYRYGGSLHIMHDEAFWINFYQFRLMESIYEDMQKVCPDAWYLLVANPVLAGITYLKRKYPDSRIVGLCHGCNGVYNVADVLGFDREDIRFEMSGVNHMIWLNHFTYKGKDAFPILDEWIQTKSEEYGKTCSYSNGMGPKAVDLYKRYGAFPIGDTGNPGGGSWGWWYHTGLETEDKWNEDPARWFREIYFEANENMVRSIKEAAEDPTIKVSEKFPPHKTTEPMVGVIESIAYDVPRIIITNIQNDKEYVKGVPRDFEVEIPTLVSGAGIEGIKCKDLPKGIIAHILRDRVAPVEVELEAYTTGNYDMLLDLILMDPWTKDEETARTFIEEILSLPELKEMKEHFSTQSSRK